MIILDCCYSGAAGQGFKGAVDDQLQQLNNARGTYLVTASTELQVAHESAAEGLSLFTKHLIAGLETGDADKHGTGWVSMNELYDYVQSHVVAENPAQQPTKHVKEERGGLLIAKSGRDSRKERAEKIESYFYNLAKEKRILKDILLAVLELIEKTESQFSSIEKQQYCLAVAIFEEKIDCVEFVRKWDRISLEIEKLIQNTQISKTIFNEKTVEIVDSEDELSINETDFVKTDSANSFGINMLSGIAGFASGLFVKKSLKHLIEKIEQERGYKLTHEEIDSVKKAFKDSKE